MTKTDAQIRLSAYLKSHFIRFETDFCDSIPRFMIVQIELKKALE